MAIQANTKEGVGTDTPLHTPILARLARTPSKGRVLQDAANRLKNLGITPPKNTR